MCSLICMYQTDKQIVVCSHKMLPIDFSDWLHPITSQLTKYLLRPFGQLRTHSFNDIQNHLLRASCAVVIYVSHDTNFLHHINEEESLWVIFVELARDFSSLTLLNDTWRPLRCVNTKWNISTTNWRLKMFG